MEEKRNLVENRECHKAIIFCDGRQGINSILSLPSATLNAYALKYKV